jgi:hypothetical protein
MIVSGAGMYVSGKQLWNHDGNNNRAVKCHLKHFLEHLFFSSTQMTMPIKFANSTAMHEDLKTLHPGGIRTRDLLFCRRT